MHVVCHDVSLWNKQREKVAAIFFTDFLVLEAPILCTTYEYVETIFVFQFYGKKCFE